jgi:hypothetical protein
MKKVIATQLEDGDVVEFVAAVQRQDNKQENEKSVCKESYY